MSASLFDYARTRARDYVRAELKKNVKLDTGPVAKILIMTLEKTLADLINGKTDQTTGLTVADHLTKWTAKYYLFIEKSGGGDMAVNPLPLSEDVQVVLNRLNNVVMLSCYTQVQDRKTVVNVHGVPDNNNGRALLEQLYGAIGRPTWGDEELMAIVKSGEGEGKALEQEEIHKRLSELDAWALESDSISKTYEFKDYSEAMGHVSTISTISRQEGKSMNVLVNMNLVKVYMRGFTDGNFLLARKLDEAVKERG